MNCCEPKGYLSLLVLWLIRQGKRTGAEITSEIEKRKGTRPSPGTIYPVLKFLKEKKLVKVNENNHHSLTKLGEEELRMQLNSFIYTFSDFNEMKKCCFNK